MHDGFGVWRCARRLKAGSLVRARLIEANAGAAMRTLTQQKFDALAVGLPWERLPQSQVITRI